jgi:predicted nucleotidyltransferase
MPSCRARDVTANSVMTGADNGPDQGHTLEMSTRSNLFDPTIRPAGAPFTPGEQRLLASFVANSQHRLGSAAIERILVFGSRARGEGGEDSDLDLAVFVSRDAPRSIMRDLTEIAESTQEGREDLPHLRPIVVRDGDGTSRRLLDSIMQDGIELWAKTSA